MFGKIKEVLTKALDVICVDYVADNIYEIPAAQTKYLMGK